MENNILQLLKKFEEIKQEGLHKSLRSGSTGIGYTFECLIGKNEDTSFTPDYKGIEIKTKLGYSKTPLTLFSLTPKSNSDYTIKNLVFRFGYPESSFSEFKVLRALATCNSTVLVAKRYYFDLLVDRNNRKIKLLIRNIHGVIISDDVFWDFEELRNRLETKLKYMALVIGYPYMYDNVTYYKYFRITIYRLKLFEDFLELIEKGIIKIIFNVGIDKSALNYGKIYDHGTSFKIPTAYIYRLFNKIVQR